MPYIHESGCCICVLALECLGSYNGEFASMQNGVREKENRVFLERERRPSSWELGYNWNEGVPRPRSWHPGERLGTWRVL